MYEPFKFDKLLKERNWAESFNLDMGRSNAGDTIFTEAVFTDGKKTLAPIIDAFANLKEWFQAELKDKGDKFDAFKFVKGIKFKELEDALTKVFGFRNVEIMCDNNGWDAKKRKFHDETLNCYTWPTWRYTIDGLVTDKGFYDETHSINTRVVFTLGLLNILSAEECTAVLLHEIGHNLDPALVDIKYTQTNAFSKYLTERENKLTDKEKASVEKGKLNFIGILVIMGVYFIGMIIAFIAKAWSVLHFNKDKAIDQIKNNLRKDKRFSRITNQEAFADNFARMYGLAGALMGAMDKIDAFFEKQRSSHIKREKERQWFISKIVQASIADVHKTDIHRIHSLIREYEADMKDPNIPEQVKAAAKADLDELKLVLESYTHDRSAFAARVNKVIKEELEAADIRYDREQVKKDKEAQEKAEREKRAAEEKAKEAKPDDKVKTESVDLLSAVITEGGKPGNFILPKRLSDQLPFRIDRLALIDKTAAMKLANASSLAGSIAQTKKPYDEDQYYCYSLSRSIPYSEWDVIDITDLYLKTAAASPLIVKIDTVNELPQGADPSNLLMKSHCLGSGIRIKDGENIYCFMQIMTTDLPDPNVFGDGVEIAQVITTTDDRGNYGNNYWFITSKTIPENPVGYRVYGEEDDCRSKFNVRAAELSFEQVHGFQDIWDFVDQLISSGQTIDIGSRTINFAEIAKLPVSSNNKAFICKKEAVHSLSCKANIGGYTRKCQDADEPCLLGITCDLTFKLGEHIGDCGSIWVDLKGNCDWDCY